MDPSHKDEDNGVPENSVQPIPNKAEALTIDNSIKKAPLEMTSQKARKQAEYDEMYMAEQRRQDIYYAAYENGSNDPNEIPDIDQNLLWNIERRKKKNTCPHCKGNIENGDIRSHLKNCAEAKVALEKRRQSIIDLGRSGLGSSIGASHDVSVATSSVEKHRKPENSSHTDTENSSQPIPKKARVKKPIEDNANSDSSGEITFKPPIEVSQEEQLKLAQKEYDELVNKDTSEGRLKKFKINYIQENIRNPISVEKKESITEKQVRLESLQNQLFGKLSSQDPVLSRLSTETPPVTLTEEIKKNSSQNHIDPVLTQTILFKPAEESTLKFDSRTISLDDQEKIRVQRNDHDNISNFNMIFNCEIMSGNHATISYKTPNVYLQDHSTHGTTVMHENGLVTNLIGQQMVQIKTGDIINFANSCSGGIVGRIEITPGPRNLSQYEQDRLSNIEEREFFIPPKLSEDLNKKRKVDQTKNNQSSDEEISPPRKHQMSTRLKTANQEEDAYTFNCYKCDRQFGFKDQLEIHVTSHDFDLEAEPHSIHDMLPDSLNCDIGAAETEDQLDFYPPPSILPASVTAEPDHDIGEELIKLREKTSLRTQSTNCFLARIEALLKDKFEIRKITEECVKFDEWDWSQFDGKFPAEYDERKVTVDKNAASIYKSGGHMNKMPVYVPHDNDSLYSSMSLLMCGDTCLALELRASTVISMAKNWPQVLEAASDKGLTAFGSGILYSEEMKKATSVNSRQGTVQFIAMVWAIKTASILVYPQVSLTDTDSISNQGMFGGSKFPFRDYFIMWSGQKFPTEFKPEHFIPLVPSNIKDVANVVSTAEYEEIVETLANAPDTKVSYSNFGQRIKKPKVYETLLAVKNEKLLEKIPPGNKSNKSYFIKRTDFTNGPGSIIDDKHPYNGSYGSSCYAYTVSNGKFCKAASGYVSTAGQHFTYKKGDTVSICDENWIISWTYSCSRNRKDAELKRHATYFITKNPEFTWMNDIAMIEYVGVDPDEFSNTKPHGNSHEGDPFRRTKFSLIKESAQLHEAGVSPRKIYDVKRNTSRPSEGLRNPTQIYNAANRLKREKFGNTFGSSGSDQMLKVFR